VSAVSCASAAVTAHASPSLGSASCTSRPWRGARRARRQGA